jgi:plasmid replication initiation protein
MPSLCRNIRLFAPDADMYPFRRVFMNLQLQMRKMSERAGPRRYRQGFSERRLLRLAKSRPIDTPYQLCGASETNIQPHTVNVKAMGRPDFLLRDLQLDRL